MSEVTIARPEIGAQADAFAQTIPLPGTSWRIWQIACLRSTGFPASGLSVFGGRAARAAAVAGAVDDEQFRADVAAEEDRLATLLDDDGLGLAIAWQNRAAWEHIAKLAIVGKPANSRARVKRRSRARALAMYWQRYCAKSETIGFFGPSALITLGQDGEDGQFELGPHLVRRRIVLLEAWAAGAIGQTWSADEDIRAWLPLAKRVDVHLDVASSAAIVPPHRRVRLSAAELEFVQRCDSRTPYALLASGVSERFVQRLVHKKVLTWGALIPSSADAWDVLCRRAESIQDPAVAAHCAADIAAIQGGLDQVSAARDAQSLVAALDGLDRAFETITGRPAQRAPGQSYAGRTLCYQDTARDLTMRVGSAALAPHRAALAFVADSARWLTAQLAADATTQLEEIVRTAAHGDLSTLSLAEVWPASLAVFWGGPMLERVRNDFAERWRLLLAPTPAEVAAGRLRRETSALAARSPFATPADPGPLRVHSPDLQFIARSADELLAGDSTAVLSEMHAGMASLDEPLFTWTLGGPCDQRDRISAASGERRLVPLFPDWWERNTGRFVLATCGESEPMIGFTDAVALPGRTVVPATAIRFAEHDGQILTRLPTGESYTLGQTFAVPLYVIAADAFKIGIPGAHAPRVTIDALVVFRETWRCPIGDIGLGPVMRAWPDYLSLQRLRDRLGMPRRVFIKVPGQTKPTYLDFDSPTLVAAIVNQLRAHAAAADEVVFTECLPDPEQSWLTDSRGRRFVSELRLQMTPEPSKEATRS